jgi:predicted TIM-barrel fold metal-dependent hydrolase
MARMIMATKAQRTSLRSGPSVSSSAKTSASGISRRQFVALAGAAVAATQARPSGLLHAAEPPGRAGFCLDAQSHLFVPEILERMKRRTTEPFVEVVDGALWVRMPPWHRKVLPKHTDVSAKLADMDASGITMTALSVNDPGPEWFGADGPAVARVMNDFIADIVRRHPQRFIGLCVLPWQDMKAARTELERCVRDLGMKGILLYTNLAGRFADEPEFRPLFGWAVEFDVPVLLHPAKPMTSELLKDYEMISAVGNMFDNTIALTRILMAGILDQQPKLKLLCPHLGGTLPYIIGRLDHQTQVLKRGPKYLTRAPSEYLKQVWFDIVSPLPAAMRFAYDYLGPDRLLYASDHPWVAPGTIRGALESLKLPPADTAKILGGNARKLFKL